MSSFAVSIVLHDPAPVAAQAQAFVAALTQAQRDQVLLAWRAQLAALLPPAATDTWEDVLVEGLASHDEAAGVGAGLVAGWLREHAPGLADRRLVALPLAADGWIPCGRNCHGGGYAVAVADGPLSTAPLELSTDLAGVAWRSLVAFQLRAVRLVRRS